MKKTMIGLALSMSLPAFATNFPAQCSGTSPKNYIEHTTNIKGSKIDLIHVFGNAARELYVSLDGDQTWITEKGKELVIVSQVLLNGEINCYRVDRIKNNKVCADYECEI